jgi:pimeloyl-ACP methyl ester carboxylesterase
MNFLFKDESFSFETLRTAGFCNYGGAELSEVLATARAIPEGNEVAWHSEWKRTADRIRNIGVRSLASGDRVSAREAFLRASNYYRTAEFYLREDPANDPEVQILSALSRETFTAATNLMDAPVEAVQIPYGGTILPGYLFLVDSSGKARPTIVFNSGFDSTLEEAYFAIAAGALSRGYNVLAFDGPGQGAALREQGLHFRHDWEAVIRPVIDYALRRPEIAAKKIALMGYSLGGYFAARAAAFEPRISALILNGGVFSYHDVNMRVIPPFLRELVMSGRDDVALPIAEMLMQHDTSVRWGLQNGRWTFGASSVTDYVRRTKPYTLEGVAERIRSSSAGSPSSADQEGTEARRDSIETCATCRSSSGASA